MPFAAPSIRVNRLNRRDFSSAVGHNPRRVMPLRAAPRPLRTSPSGFRRRTSAALLAAARSFRGIVVSTPLLLTRSCASSQRAHTCDGPAMAKQTLEDSARDAEPTAAEVRAALERILRSRCFEHATRASDFLRFVVDKTLAGDGRELKGYTIAIHVFGRSADFDAKSDPLVRVEALRLRQRLTEYYAGEGAEERVRLELPRGGYALKATFASPPAASGAAAPAPALRQRNSVALLWS